VDDEWLRIWTANYREKHHIYFATMGEIGFYMFSNTLPASVEINLGVLEDRAIQRAESLPTWRPFGPNPITSPAASARCMSSASASGSATLTPRPINEMKLNEHRTFFTLWNRGQYSTGELEHRTLNVCLSGLIRGSRFKVQGSMVFSLRNAALR